MGSGAGLRSCSPQWWDRVSSFLLFEFLCTPQSNWNEIVDSFDDMNLSESLLRGIYAYGFEKPSAIQQRAILPCIKGKIFPPQNRVLDSP